TTLLASETFTGVDFRINFFRPLWNATLRARANVVQLGKTISYYECKITDEKERLIAMATSSVMTLRGESAKGR
ncbi:PaaI family thioesterase, partial [Vibrio parahaemolyticus]